MDRPRDDGRETERGGLMSDFVPTYPATGADLAPTVAELMRLRLVAAGSSRRT